MRATDYNKGDFNKGWPDAIKLFLVWSKFARYYKQTKNA